ncbi:hypothetical protein LG289_08780 [Planococcus rifietoensis]
MKLRFPTLNQ